VTDTTFGWGSLRPDPVLIRTRAQRAGPNPEAPMGVFNWYTNQVIFEFLTGVRDGTIISGRNELVARARSKLLPCNVVTFTPIFK
jgi:hypothetical protein